jgi:hypothetical protein
VTRTLMWEAKAAPGHGAELLDWALEHADPAAEVYRGADGRVVVIDGTGRGMPAPPARLLARTPHVWPFERVGR